MKSGDFSPLRRRGRNFHLIIMVVLTILVVVLAVLISRQPINLVFTGLILLAVLAFLPIPILVYRLYALTRANYNLNRDQLTLSWGLRVEQIPVSEIEWVRPLSALSEHIPMPFFRLPGSLLGSRRHRDLGPIEFLASDEKSLLLVATPRKIFAISPETPGDFLQEIQRAIEMGSLTPTVSKSIYPSFVVAQAWDNLTARYLWLAGLFTNIGLLAWVSLLTPSLKHISLGFLPSTAARHREGGQPCPHAGCPLEQPPAG
jgi:hypothetical protein